MSDYFRQHAVISGFNSESWVILNEMAQRIKNKIEKVGLPLKKWDIKINYGIKTGLNDAFIIDERKRQELIEKSPKSEEIIRPILRGRDIDKYKSNWGQLYLIHIPWHFPLHRDNSIMGASVEAEKEFKRLYPAIYTHLLNYKHELSKRNKAETGIRYEWYALQRWGANYMDDFFKHKIIWKRIGSVLRFSYDETGIFCLDSTCFATGEDMKFLVGYLNSTISRRELLNNSPKTGTGDVITSVQALEPLLVPRATEKQKDEIVKLVDNCIEILTQNPDGNISQIENEIDKKIFNLYGFNDEEISFIKSQNI